MSSMSAQLHNKSVTNTECNFDTLISAQKSSIPLVDYSSEDEIDESCFGISPQGDRSSQDKENCHGASTSIEMPLIAESPCIDYEDEKCFRVSPQTSSTTSQSHILGDRYSENTETARDSKPVILIPSGTIDHPSVDTRNEDCHGISFEMPLITVKPHHGSGDVQIREAEHRADLDFLIPTRAPSSAMEPCLMVSRDGNVGGKEVPCVNPFQGASNVEIKDTNIITTGGDATFIQFGDSPFTEIERNSICDYIANLTVLPDIDYKLKKHILTQSIISLPRAEAMFCNYQTSKKSGPCFEGTRVALLREMADWVTSSDESRMYVLSGLAGIGKSTIAYTIASRASKVNLLGASFFFSRDEDDRKNAKRFFTTIAYQLCIYDEIFAKAIGDVLLTERGSAATTNNPQEQLQVLILEPLRSIVRLHNRPILVVVDALDECGEDDEHVVFNGLCQLVRNFPLIKVILTTRPQPSIEAFLSSHGGHKLFRLQDIEDKVIDDDIRLYLNYSLSLDQVQKHHSYRQWYASEEEINSLVRAAGRLFIVASTVVRYILDKTASNPMNQMKKLLHAFSQARTPFKDLDQFYTVILRNVVPENCDDDDISNRYQSVVGAIILLQHPLPISTLTHVINIDVSDIRVVLDKLQSVILVGDDDVPRIYHKSFPDYVMDQGRCKDPRLQIYPRILHTQIATHCFDIMDKDLKYNILGLGNPARFMKNEDGLKEDEVTDEQLEEKIPQQLRYACVYWINHLRESNHEHLDLMNMLEKFLNEHLLHWLEVLSLIGKMDSAYGTISAVLKLVQSTSLEMDQLLSDALRFISKFYEIIERSALHTYYSALGFTPTDSLLYRRYNKEAVDKIFVISGGPEKWDALVAKLSHGGYVQAIKFSLDSSLFVSWSELFVSESSYDQGSMTIWDASTGTPISTIPGDRFAIANDFSTIASAENSSISYYNVNGSARGAMFTTSATIQRLALSSESNRIAAALDDGTVLLWDSRNYQLIGSFNDFQRNIYIFLSSPTSFNEFRSNVYSFLQFSPTGTRLAYPSLNDNYVKLRDGISGRFIADLECGSRCHFKFSGDGSRIASLTHYHLKLWNSESGALIDYVSKKDVGGPHPVYYELFDLAISTNGYLLATAKNPKVRLWRENHGHLAQIKVLTLDWPRSITFSVGNILAITTGLGVQLYDVKTRSFISTLPCDKWSNMIAFSPDWTRLAINKDGIVYLLDIQGMDASRPPLKENPKALTAWTLSQDCSRLACRFEDGVVELWETNSTTVAKQRINTLGLRSKIKAFLPRSFGFGLFRRKRIVTTSAVTTLAISPDGNLLASGLNDRIKLWNGNNGSLRGTLKVPHWLQDVALSNNVLVAGWNGRSSGVTLWNLDTLNLIHTSKDLKSVSKVSIAENSAIIAIADTKVFHNISLLDVMKKTIIATFDVPYRIHTMTFLPHNSHFVVQSNEGVVQSFDLINKHIIEGPTLEHLIQLPDIPLWHSVPIWHCEDKEQHYFSALFPQPVPILWIPKQISVAAWTQGASMIALYCDDRRVIFLRLTTARVS